MKELISQYKPFLLFLGKFFLSYLVLTLVYHYYLSGFDVQKNEVDSFTNLIARQTNSVLRFFDSTAYIAQNSNEPTVKVFYQNTYVCRIIEGCNALSVMILFVSFVVAFTGKLKTTIVFVLFGCMLIHVLNIARIALLSMALYHFSEQEYLLHDVVFPLVIYGAVFLLWIIWVNKYSLHVTAIDKK